MSNSSSVGTYIVDDLLVNKFTNTGPLSIEEKEEALRVALTIDLPAWQNIANESIAIYATPTTERELVVGTSHSAGMGQDVGETGRAKTRKSTVGETVQFPIRRFSFGYGNTFLYQRLATAADIQDRIVLVTTDYTRRLIRQWQVALYSSANLSFEDGLGRNGGFSKDIIVRRMFNADGQAIPNNPRTQESFDKDTHTHYLFEGSFSADKVQEGIDTVMEHALTANMRVVISSDDRTNFTSLTSDSRWLANQNPNNREPQRDTSSGVLDLTQNEDVMLGWFNQAEVWVKPYGVAGYTATVNMTGPRPLAYRQMAQSQLQGLRVDGSDSNTPLQAEWFEAIFDYGGHNRGQAALIDHSNAGGYVDPVFPEELS